MKNFLFLIFFVATLASCAENRTMTLNEGTNLSLVQISKHEKMALSGNKDSISKLINYYQYSDFQPEKIAYWYEIDASFGNIESKYKSGVMYSLGEYDYTVTKSSCEKGLLLLNECQLLNYKDSKEVYVNAQKNCEIFSK